jgi:hypothetical protein
VAEGRRGLVNFEEKYEKLWQANTTAETNLYSTPNR